MCSSQQAFQKMLSSFMAGAASSSRPPPLPAKLDIAIHQYYLDSFQPLHEVTIVGHPAWHQLNASKPRVQKPPVVLPFGLTMPKRKRKARNPADRTTSGRAVRSRICDLSTHAIDGFGNNMQTRKVNRHWRNSPMTARAAARSASVQRCTASSMTSISDSGSP